MAHDVEGMTRGAPTESRAEEAREQEGPGEGEPTPDARLTSAEAPTNALGYDEVEARTDLARYLQPSVFPARPPRLVASARDMGAPSALVDRLGTLADDLYDTVEQVWEALGGRRERGDGRP